MDVRNYDIAVVGESMAGKSTWISELCRKDAAEVFGAIHKENRQGQTKVAVHYLLRDTGADSFYVESVKWNYDKLAECLQNGQKETVKELLAPLGLILEERFSDGDTEMELKKYLESGEAAESVRKSQNLPEFVKNVANSKAFGELGIISRIELSVPAAPEVWKEISGRGLDFVRVRDTRGFLDESADRMQELFRNAEKRREEKEKDGMNAKYGEADLQKICIRDMLDERGISGTDAVVFMGVSCSNALCKENMREIYGSMIADMLEKHPVFLTVRTDEMTRLMMQKDGAYRENCESVLNDENFSGLEDLERLLEDFRNLFDGLEDYKADIARKNCHKLLLANLSERIRKEKKECGKEIYRVCAFGAFCEVMDGIRRYRESMETAERCLKEIGNPAAKLKEIYDREFMRSVKPFETGDSSLYYSDLFGIRTPVLAGKLLGPYRGGMVGLRGGLTTYIYISEGMKIRVGEYAILMLEAVYRLEERLLPELVEKLEPEIEQYVRQRAEGGKVLETVKKEKESLHEKFTRHLETESERLFCTERMVRREYLEGACKQTQAYFKQEDATFGQCFPELEGRFPDDAWEKSKGDLAVVKYAAWRLMVAHLHLKEMENDER